MNKFVNSTGQWLFDGKSSALLITCYSVRSYHCRKLWLNQSITYLFSDQKYTNLENSWFAVQVQATISADSVSCCDQSQAEVLERSRTERRRRRRRQENDMTLTVIVIFISYLLCNLPANIVLLIDPTAQKIPKVRIKLYCWQRHLNMTSILRPTSPPTSWPGSTQLSTQWCTSVSTCSTRRPSEKLLAE